MRIPLLAAGVLFASAAALPVAAQTYYDNTPTVGEVVVEGPALGPDGRPDRLSQAVSYADLDLATWSGRDTLRHRIRQTARDLCDRLGESGRAGDPLMRSGSCEDEAVRGAMRQMNLAVDEAYADAYANQASVLSAAAAEADWPR